MHLPWGGSHRLGDRFQFTVLFSAKRAILYRTRISSILKATSQEDTQKITYLSISLHSSCFAHLETETIRRAQDFEGLLARTTPYSPISFATTVFNSCVSHRCVCAGGDRFSSRFNHCGTSERLIRIGHVTRQFWKICLLATHPKKSLSLHTKCTPPARVQNPKFSYAQEFGGMFVWEWVVSEFERRHKLSRANPGHFLRVSGARCRRE